MTINTVWNTSGWHSGAVATVYKEPLAGAELKLGGPREADGVVAIPAFLLPSEVLDVEVGERGGIGEGISA